MAKHSVSRIFNHCYDETNGYLKVSIPDVQVTIAPGDINLDVSAFVNQAGDDVDGMVVHTTDFAGYNRVGSPDDTVANAVFLKTTAAGALSIDVDGVYNVTTNADPDNIGLVACANAGTPADANQTIRLTGGTIAADALVSANSHGLDVRSYLYGYNGATWDRIDTVNTGQLKVTSYSSAGAALFDAAARAGYVYVTDGTNTQPTGDALARSIFVSVGDGTTTAVVETSGTKKALNVNVTDGTNDMPTMDAVARAGYQFITDGTNTMPTMDVVARAGFFQLTDGTNTANTMDAVGRAGYQYITDGTNTMPTMDVLTRAGFVTVTDGTTNVDILPLTSATTSAGLLSVAGEIVDFDTTGSDDPTPAIGILGASASGAIPLLCNADGSLKVDPTSSADFSANGEVLVPGAATRVQMTSVAAREVIIRAKTGNAGTIYVGDSAVAAANGYELVAGESIVLPLSANLNEIYIDTNNNGDGVRYIINN